jgi:hypothetical protein
LLDFPGSGTEVRVKERADTGNIARTSLSLDLKKRKEKEKERKEFKKEKRKKEKEWFFCSPSNTLNNVSNEIFQFQWIFSFQILQSIHQRIQRS